MRTAAATLLAVLVTAAASPASVSAGDPERLEPKPVSQSVPGVPYLWTSRNGLNFCWLLPQGFNWEDSVDAVTILHGTGLDHRWGPANFPPAALPPNTMMISVDGTSQDGKSRVFLDEAEDVMTFRDFALDMGRTFPISRQLYYGHSQGSFFAAMFAGRFPALCDGVVAHASGAWTSTPTRGGILSVPIVFMHGRRDNVVPFGQSIGAVQVLREAGSDAVALRRLPGYNHWPNAVRAGECLEWCVAMGATDAERILSGVERMLVPKPPDEYEYVCPVWYGGARRALSRLTGESDPMIEDEPPTGRSLKDPPEEIASRAKAIVERIEQEGWKHAAAIRGGLRLKPGTKFGPSDAVLDGSPWAGHLVAMREDFRWVRSVNALLEEIRWGDTAQAHSDAAKPLLEAWYGETTDREKFEAAVDCLPRCFLFDGLPFDLIERCKAWHAKAAEMGLSAESLEKYENVLLYEKMMKEGERQYEAIWKQWKFESRGKSAAR